jgi:hypothetical protein
MKKLFCSKTLFAVVLAILIAVGSAPAEPWKFGQEPWKFAVMADTQWISQTSGVITDNTRAPNSVPVDIVRALNRQFINQGVKFVIEVGDLSDSGTPVAEDTRALFAQDLYNAGIGFFPFRGNHEAQTGDPAEFLRVYPQTQTGSMNNTPTDIFNSTVVGIQPIPAIHGKPFHMGFNFNSPNTANSNLTASNLTGLSYSFDYNNNGFGNTVRFVLLDGQAAPGTDGKTPGIDPQQPWITNQLVSRPAGSHAFVMSHKGLITENHVDMLFGSDPSQDILGQQAFFDSLYSNNVRYYINGHDHMHDRSRIVGPNSSSYVNQLLCASDSSKFYTPGYPLANNNDVFYDTPAHGINNGPRQTILSQELHKVGYYIFTVDGPNVTVDYYSASLPASTNLQPNGCSGSKCEYLITNTTAAATNSDFLTFVKAETFGYGLNGKEFLVPKGATYTTVQDKFEDTTAKILDGTNGSTVQDYSTRPLTKAVDTGWVDVDGWCERYPAQIWSPDLDLASDILTLWGMADLGASHTDTYALSLSYDHRRLLPIQLGKGLLGLVTRDAKGRWVNAVDLNAGGTKKFVLGPWKSDYELGTYGVDLKAGTVWAVINYNGDFAAAGFRHF